METGQPYLMPNKNKILQDNNVYLHFFKDGFYFCKSSEIVFIPTNNNSNDLNKALNLYLDSEVQESLNEISIILFQNPSTFVPLSLFDKSLSKRYLNLFNKAKDNEVLAYDILNEIKQVNVYSYPKYIYSVLKKSKIDFCLLHYNTILYRQVLNISSSIKFNYQLFIHFQLESIDIFLIRDSKVKFNNRFSVKNEDEFLYYLFFVVEQFNLTTDEYELIFLGRINSFENYYKAVNQYHNNIKFIDQEKNKLLDLQIHKAPYLALYSS